MSDWRNAKSLLRLRDQINSAYPDRNKASDGFIGDAAHQRVASDHNPNLHGVVTAFDITHDPLHGLNVHALFDRLLANRHPDLKYLISNRRIAGAWTNWKWTPYYGSDPHDTHGHVSVGVGDDGKSEQPYDDPVDWNISGYAPAQVISTTPSQLKTVTLPANVDTWAAYKVGSGYRKGTSDQRHADGRLMVLLPSKFKGITYNIVENRGNVVVVDTEAYGRVAIWVQGTEAIFGGGTAGPKPSSLGQTVTFPRSAGPWRVYKVGSQYRPNTEDQIDKLRPDVYGDLTYPIVENRGNVVVIDTADFGRVAAWVKDTSAIIR